MSKKKTNFPSFGYERTLWKLGCKRVAGVDEVGRGCFAGPVVSGCVVFNHNILSLISEIKVKINDSKKLTAKQREASEKWIKENALSWGIGEAPASLINRIGLSKATRVAFRRAVTDANKRLARKGEKIDYLLLDAFYIPYIRGLPKQRGKKLKGSKTLKDGLAHLLGSKAKQLAVIDGDEKSISISAASIVAKVYRDSLMEIIGSKKRYKKYGWVNNKGYGTKDHQEAIQKLGITSYHRKQFVTTFLNNSFSSPAR